MPEWIEYRKGVPGGSKLYVRATSIGDAAVEAAIVSTGDDDGTIASDQIEPGPGSWPLMASEVYLIKARVGFTGPGSTTVEMWIERPDGSMHSTPAVWEAASPSADVHLCSLIVQTV